MKVSLIKITVVYRYSKFSKFQYKIMTSLSQYLKQGKEYNRCLKKCIDLD